MFFSKRDKEKKLRHLRGQMVQYDISARRLTYLSCACPGLFIANRCLIRTLFHETKYKRHEHRFFLYNTLRESMGLDRHSYTSRQSMRTSQANNRTANSQNDV